MTNNEDISYDEMTGEEKSKKWWTDPSSWRSPLEKKYRGDSYMWTVMSLPLHDIQRLMKDERRRYRTFVHIWPNTTSMKFKAFGEFAEAGFYYTGKKYNDY